METPRQISGTNINELWQQLEQDLQQEGELLTYTALLQLNNHQTLLDIDIDLGGGFESGISTTVLRAEVPQPVSLRFNLQEQDLMNEFGKFFGMEDITLGYSELDEAFIVQTNQPETVKALFADVTLRHTLLKYPAARLQLMSDTDSGASYLQFSIDEAIVESSELREVYQLLQAILEKISGNHQQEMP